MQTQMAIITYPQPHGMQMTMAAQSLSAQEAQQYRAKGCSIETVSYAEYERRTKKKAAFEKSARRAKHKAMGWSNLKGLDMPLHAVPDNGTEVRFRHGECYGRKIVWGDVEEAFLRRDSACNLQDEQGVVILNERGERQGGFAGWESRRKVWYRYASDARHAQSREHCMQIISISH